MVDAKTRKKDYKSTSGSKKSSTRAYTSSSTSKRDAKISAARMRYPVQSKPRSAMTDKKWSDGAFFPNANNATAVASVEVQNTGSIHFVGGVIAQATGAANSRIGRSIILKSFQFQGYVKANSAGVAQWGKWMLILDDDPGTNLPTLSEIFDTNLSTNYTTGGLQLDFRKLQTTDRFRVLKAGNICMSGYQNEDNIQDLSFYYKPPQDIEIRYKSDGSATYYNGIEKGALLFVTFGSEASGNSAMTITGTHRLRYIDP